MKQETLEKIGIGVGFLLVLALVIALLVRLLFVNFVDNHEFGYRFNALTGEITELKQKGYVWSAPFVVSIHTIDTRPFQVTVSANNRVLNAKLVQFNPKGYKLFIAWHGRDNYSQETLRPILTSYAFDPSQKDYPFVTILKELKNGTTDKLIEVDSTAVPK